jgi:hypothetical protein
LIASSVGNSKHRGLGKEGHFKGANGLSHPSDTCCRRRILLSYWCYYPRVTGVAAITPIRHYVSL